MQNLDVIVDLLKDYLKGALDSDQQKSVEQLFQQYPQLKDLIDELDSENGLEAALKDFQTLFTPERTAREDLVLENILTRIRQDRPSAVKRMKFWRVTYGTVAATILMLLVLFFWKRAVPPPRLAKAHKIDFSAGHNTAFLTTTDGKKVQLSANHAGIIIKGKITYDDGSDIKGKDELSNNGLLTLSTPRGGQYQATLSDGTKVWLNAATTLHYPQQFDKNIRTVELDGEAYFEVAHNADKPFIVQTRSGKVRVLGTHFNVDCYRDEASSAVTLLEGRVTVSINQNERLSTTLKPGQQSTITGSDLKVSSVNVEDFVAWKEGEFMFNNENLSSVMQKIARWYNLDITVSDELKNIKIWGSVSRYDSFQQVLKLITMTDERIKFKIEERRIMLMK